MNENRYLRKIAVFCLAVMLLTVSCVQAEELPARTDEGTSAVNDAEDRLTAFFYYWAQGRLDDMLAMCASGWKSEAEDPRTALFAILANRVPVDVTVESMEGDPATGTLTVRVTSMINRNNGKPYAKYRLEVVMIREADGLWYVDPVSLQSCENVREDPPAAAEDGTLLYYVPEGGEYYHLDPNCRRVHEQYLPMTGVFTFAELGDEPYRNLKPCEVCGAPAAREELPSFTCFSDAIVTEDLSLVTMEAEYLAAAIRRDGKYYRVITMLDDHAKDLFRAALESEDPDEGLKAFDAYTWALPVDLVEEITAAPKEQAELDAQTGRTVGELESEGYYISGSGGGVGVPVTIDLSYGFFNYEFEADATFREYQEYKDRDDLESLKLKNGRFSGFSYQATDLNLQADGTYIAQPEPDDTWERKVITALATRINPYDLKSVMVDARIIAYNRERNTLTLEIITPECYDADEVRSLRPGDAIYTQGREFTIDAIQEYDCFISLTQDPNDTIILSTDDDTVCQILDGDDFSWTVVATVNVPVMDYLLFLDDIDPATGEALPIPTVHSAEEFTAILEAGDPADPGFAVHNTTVVFDESGALALVRRHYVPWQ